MFNEIIDAATFLVAKVGHVGIFLAALIETIFPPIPSEVIYPLVGYTAQSNGLGLEYAIGMAAAGALGSTVGAFGIYFVALKVGRRAILKLKRYTLFDESKLLRAEQWFEKHGSIAIFAGRLAPGVRELISVPAGLGKMNLVKFGIFTFLGSLVWSIALTLLGFYLGEAWSRFFEKSQIFDIVALVIVAAACAVFGYLYYRASKGKS